MKNPSTRPAAHSRGSALLVVLAFLLLLTTLTVAFLSRATLERQLSNASFSQGKVDLAGQGAIAAIIGDLQQEIVAGSNINTGTTTPFMASGYYYPNSSFNAVPALVVPGYTTSTIVGTGMENLLKTSEGSTAFWPGSSTGTYSPATGPSRVSSVSTNTASLNNRSVSNARWNKPLLMTPVNVVFGSSTTDFTPPNGTSGTGTFTAPNWIYVARDGSNPTSTTWDTSWNYSPNVLPTASPTSNVLGTNAVTQRYAYTIYDEGGTLDLNVAGSPSTSTSNVQYSANQPYKYALAYADLTQLPGIGVANGNLAAVSTGTITPGKALAFVNAIVGWRNFASAGYPAASVFPNTYSSGGSVNSVLKNPSGTVYNVATAYDQNVLFNPNSFLTVGGVAPQYGGGSTPEGAQDYPSQTDNAFVSRQQLIQFFLQGLGQNTTFIGNVPLANLEGVLPYLGTFSRDISQPSYAPDPNRPVVLNETSGGNDMAGLLNTGTNNTYTYTLAAATTAQNTLNPSLLNVAVTGTFTRNDGTTAVIGEPLIKKRFALSRLAWLTYEGPVADRTTYMSTTIAGSTAPTAASGNYDIWALVNTYGIPQSFLAQGTDANIAKYFGLAWLGGNANNLYGTGTTSDSSITIGINDGTQKWKYVHGTKQTGTAATSSTTPGRICTLTQVQADGREPDFFELLKAAVTVGAIAKPGEPSGSLGTYWGYEYAKDTSVDAYIMQLGANIIAQSNVAQYCPRILFDDGTWAIPEKLPTLVDIPQEYRGVEDLPYLYRIRGNHIKIIESSPAETWTNQTQSFPFPTGFTSATTGKGEFLQIPEIFNPHNWNPSVTPPPGLKPTSFQLIPLSADPLDVDGGYPTFLGSTNILAYTRNQVFDYGDATGDPGELPAYFINGEAITFTIPATTTGAGFFRESTLLNKPDPSSFGSTSVASFGPPVGSNVLATGTATLSPSGAAQSNAQITSYYKSHFYITVATPATSCTPPSTTTDDQKYLGFNFGTLPLWFPDPTTTTITATTQMVTTGGALPGGNLYFTYQLQYADPITSGKWDTYDEKFLPLVWCNPAGGGYGMNGGTNAFLYGAANTDAYGNGSDYVVWQAQYFDVLSLEDYVVAADPRTARFSPSVLSADQPGGFWCPPPAGGTEVDWPHVYPLGWVDASQNAVQSARPDYNAGWDQIAWTSNATGPESGLGFYNPGNTGSSGSGPNGSENYYGFTPFYAQNWASNPNYGSNGANAVNGDPGSGINGTQYYADPDGVVRRGTAAYSNAPGSPATTTVEPNGTPIATTPDNGLPLETSTKYTLTTGTVTVTPLPNSSRPIILNRPFYTVGDLGYTFSGTPGKNIDFSTPESGYAALLDVFCVNDTNDPNGLVAGKVDLNTRQSAVLNAVLTGAYKDQYYPNVTTNPGISSADAAVMTTQATYGLVSRTSSTTSPYGPLRNVSELVGKYTGGSTPTAITGTSPAAYDGTLYYSGFSGDLANTANTTLTDNASPNRNLVQRYHEASIRALANCGTTRVWNLMIDVIAQTGHFPPSASSLANFNVDGERRYWVHVAIDRYTGKVLDEQVEQVKE